MRADLILGGDVVIGEFKFISVRDDPAFGADLRNGAEFTLGEKKLISVRTDLTLGGDPTIGAIKLISGSALIGHSAQI